MKPPAAAILPNAMFTAKGMQRRLRTVSKRQLVPAPIVMAVCAAANVDKRPVPFFPGLPPNRDKKTNVEGQRALGAEPTSRARRVRA